MTAPLRVLLVEDSEDDALLNLHELKTSGYAPSWDRVDTEETMRAALARGPWDLVLADHNMPHFDSFAALRLIAEAAPDVPFIIVSGSIGETQVATAMNAGASDYVLKRDLSRLASSVRRALASAHERRERKRAELALRESEERYALAMRGSRDGLWDWDILKGEIYCSERLRGMLGETLASASFEALGPLVDAEDQALVEDALRAHLAERVPFEVEFRARTQQGEPRWFCVRGQALWNEAGAPTRMAGSTSDITARKQAEALLRQRFEIIEQQQEDIRALSTPIIQVWEGVLMMPVFGAIDSDRAARMMEVLLQAVSTSRCRYAIIDLTGARQIDNHTADHIIRIVQAVQLIGAQGLVVGIRAEVARTMVSIGANLEQISTLATLRDALILCMKDQRARRR